jgi:tetratricopeptide (TPR) repeat protein
MDTFEKKLNAALDDLGAIKTPECIDTSTIGLYADNKLSGEGKTRTENHIKTCLYCLDQLAEMRELLLYQKQETSVSPQLLSKLKVLYPKQEPSTPFKDKIKELIFFPGWKYAVVSFASICLTILITLSIKTDKSSPGSPTVDMNSFVTVRALGSGGETLREAQGVVINANGLVASNLTALAGARMIEVKLRNGKTYQTRDIWKDDDKNLAVMKIDSDRLPSLSLADVSEMTIGQSAFIVTDPAKAKRGLKEALISDFKSYPGRHKDGGVQYIQLASLTSLVNRGALIDKDGKLIGLLVTEEKNINLAAPLKDMERMVKEQKAIPLSELKNMRFSEKALSFYMKGILADYAHKWDEAIVFLKQALELNPDLEGAHLELGYAYYRKRLYDLEAKEYEEALRINPRNTDALSSLAENLETRGLYEQAITAYEKVVALDPDDTLTLYDLGVAYLAQGQRAKAMEIYPKLKQLDSGAAEKLRRLNTRL